MPLTQADYRAKLNSDAKIHSKDVAKLPKPGTGSVPSSIQFHTTTTTTTTSASSDRATTTTTPWITYLAPADPTSLTRQLWATNLLNNTYDERIEVFQPGQANQESGFSLEEQLRRERARMMTTGVTSYAWAANAPIMLVPLGGALWILDDPLAAGGGRRRPEPRKLIETNTDNNNDVTTTTTTLPVGAPLLDAKISSDGSTVAFVADQEVYVISTASTTGSSTTRPEEPRQVTFGARGHDGHTNGVADYLAQEELDRSDGFWLSPHGTRLVYEAVDESHIPLYRITHQGNDQGLSPSFVKHDMSCHDVTQASQVTYEEHRYPFAGAENPKVKLGVVTTSSSSNSSSDGKEGVIWFDLEQIFGADFYLAKVEWLPPSSENNDSNSTTAVKDDSTKCVVQLLDRRQQNLALLLLDCVTGTVTVLHMEAAMKGTWINLNSAFRPLPSSTTSSHDTMQFLWASERDGYRHLYVLEASTLANNQVPKEGAKVVKRLTGPGEFIVESILAVDNDHQCIYYMGTSPGQWLDRHLFRVSLVEGASSEPVCLTASIPGMHACVLHSKLGLLVDTVSSVQKAPVVSVYKLPALDDAAGNKEATTLGEPLSQLHDASKGDDRVAALGDALQPPTFHTFPSTDGKVTLQAAMYTPDEDKYGKGPWPLVVATYGGPHVQYVANTWGMMTADMRSQFLRANGFAVLKVDNRGSNRRGLVFEAPIQGNMGDLEVADQVAGVDFAVKQGMADRTRVAVSGWSYAGYMALKCLTDRPDIFHAAISGAPVTDWTLYDTAYTERYMGLPQENPEGYIKSSALAKVKDIEGSLLLCHGLLDENVLFRQSAVLVNELVAQQKAYDLVLFASERHGPRRPKDRAFLEERILAFLQRSLGV